MATLYVENIPEDRYRALREQAARHRKSIAAEVLEMLEHFVPTEAELAERRKFVEWAAKMRQRKPLKRGPFPSSEEMIREDRER